MASVNRLKRAWAEGRSAFGLRSAVPGSFAIEQITGADLDYVLADQQQGSSMSPPWSPWPSTSAPLPSCACRRTSPG